MKKSLTLLASVLILVLVIVSIHNLRQVRNNSNVNVDVYAVLPLTGPIAQLGKTIQSSMKMYLDEHPQSKLNVIFVDSASAPDKALSALSAKTISKNRILVISALSSVSSTLIPFISQKDGFIFPILTVALSESDEAICYQRFSMGTRDVVDPIALFAKDHYNKVSVLYANEDYGLRNKSRFIQQYTESTNAEGKILSETAFDLQDKNFREIVSRVVAQDPNAIYVTGNGTATYINVIKAIAESGYKGQILADASFSNPFVYDALGAIAERVLFSCANSDLSHPNNEEALQFQTNCRKHGVIPYATTSNAYDVLGFIDMLISQGESISAKTIDSLGEYVGADHIRFIGHGDCEYTCKLAVIANGEIVEAKNEKP